MKNEPDHGVTRRYLQNVLLAIIVVVILAFFSFLLTTPQIKGSMQLVIFVSVLQILTSAAFGRFLIPMIFGNTELENYQRLVIRNVVAILTSKHRGEARTQVKNMIVSNLTDVPPAVSKQELKKLNDGVGTLFQGVFDGETLDMDRFRNRVGEIFDDPGLIPDSVPANTEPKRLLPPARKSRGLPTSRRNAKKKPAGKKPSAAA